MPDLNFNATVSELAAITDPAKFERLVTAVLRSAKPESYGNLSNPGVNTNGKTVKSPFDGLGWISGDNGSTVVGVEHTITGRDSLEGKWLHDPSTVKPKKLGGKPTQPAGDLVKAIDEVEELRESQPDLKSIIVLTCNCEEPAGLRAKTESLAIKNNVKLDIWAVSRIAQYLDTNPEGQVIRHQYLRTPITHLSRSELSRIGKESLDRHHVFLDENEVVMREFPEVFDGKVSTLISGDSGMGKTTVCLNVLNKALQEGHLGLVISDQTISEAISLEDALSLELRHSSPSLAADSGRMAIGLGSVVKPIIIVVEDVNKSVQPEKILNKLITWILQKNSESAAYWRILCPVWPQHLALLDKKTRDLAYKANIIQTIGLYTDEEAGQAVKLRLQRSGIDESELSISALAKSLGNDPLLIGLHDFSGNVSTTNVIPDFIEGELDRIAASSIYGLTDLEDAIKILMVLMLKNKSLSPSWREVKSWSNDREWLSILRVIFEARRLLSLSKNQGEELIEARHDRIQYYLLGNAVAKSFSIEADAIYLADPYFAEIVGMAFVIGEIPCDSLKVVMESNPVAAFYALKYAISIDSGYSKVASEVIESWVKVGVHRGLNYSSKRYFGLAVLAEIDSDLILRLTSYFPSIDRRGAYSKARFRNGDLSAGCEWLTEFPFSVTSSDRPKFVEYIYQKHGDRLVESISKLLITPQLHDRALCGALLISGYIATPALADPVRKAWSLYGDDKNHLEVFLWAAARVCDDDVESILAPIINVWEEFPEKDQKNGSVTVSSFAAHGVSWKFRDYVPSKAISYIVERAKLSKKLEWPITYMLRGVDDPVAVEYEVEYLANLRREGKGSFFADHFLHEWGGFSERAGQTMSSESKKCLLSISADEDNDEFLQEEAFKLWEASINPDDLEFIKTIGSQDVRFSHSIWARTRRQDNSVIPLLLKKIEEDPKYWWQAGRYIWTEEMTQALAEEIKIVASDNDREEIFILPELLSRLDAGLVSELLIPHWNKLDSIPSFVQIALNTTDPRLLERARETIRNADRPKELLEHYSMNIGIMTKGREGITRLAQLEAIQPYLGFLSDIDLHSLWEAGRNLGCSEYIKEHISPALEVRESEYIKRVFKASRVDASDLDNDMKEENPRRAYHWLEDQVRNGWDKHEVFSALMNWFQENNSIPALKVTGVVISRDGGRVEYNDLEKAAVGLQEADEILDQIRFDVYSRTLI